MTVSSQTNNETFTGNGVTTQWDLPFRFFHDDEVFVYLVDPVAFTTTPLILGTDYTLTGAGLPEQFGTAPGKITTTAPVANLKQLYVERIMQIEQLTDIVNQGRFFPEVHEDAFDRLTMLIQQADSNSRGAIRVAIGDPEPARLPSAPLRANLLMGFDGLGNPTVVAPTPDSSSALALMLANDTLVTQGAAMIGRGGQVVKSIAELKTLLVNTPSKHAFVTGYYAQGDGGGGPYYLDSLDVVSADNGGTVIVAADGGRWKLVRTGGVYLEQFGLKGDSTTDDTLAFQRALDSGVSPIIGRLDRIYRITDTITIKTHKQELILNKGEILLDDPTGLKTLLKVGGQVAQVGGVRLNSIVFTRAQAATAGYAVDFDLVGVSEMEDCRVYGNNRFWRGVRLTRSIIFGMLNNYIDNCINRGVYIIGTGTGANRTVDTTMHGNRIEGGITALETSDFVEGLFARENIFFNTSGIGVVIDATTNANGLNSFKLQENDYDTCGGGGLYIDKVSNVQVTDGWFSAVQIYSLTLGSLSDGVVVNGNQLYPAAKGIIAGGISPVITNNLISGGSNAIELGSTSNNAIVSANNIGNCSIGIVLGTAPNAMIANNNGYNFGIGMFSGTAGAGTQISDNKGDTVRGTGNFITVGASPFTYTAGNRAEYIAIYSGTVSQIALGANAIGFTTNRDVVLAPGQTVTVTYSSIPFMVKNFL